MNIVAYYRRTIIQKEIAKKVIKAFCVQIASLDIADPVHLIAKSVLIKLQIL
jgi:hypothetical protein